MAPLRYDFLNISERLIFLLKHKIIGTMKNKLTLVLAIALALSYSCSDMRSLAKMSPEAYGLFQETNVLEKEQNYSLAIEKIKKAIEISPDESILYIKLGGIYSEMGDWQNALVAYKKAIKIKITHQINN